jgi:hypothetical protein
MMVAEVAHRLIHLAFWKIDHGNHQPTSSTHPYNIDSTFSMRCTLCKPCILGIHLPWASTGFEANTLNVPGSLDC